LAVCERGGRFNKTYCRFAEKTKSGDQMALGFLIGGERHAVTSMGEKTHQISNINLHFQLGRH